MPELPFNLNLLRTLDALLETRNLTKTAQRLGLTQSAVSRQLVSLRGALDDPLLVREGQRYLLTPHAEQLQPRVKAVLAEAAALLETPAFDPARCVRQFTLCGSDYLATYMLPALIATIAPLAPLARIRFQLWEPDHFHRLADGSVDLVTVMADAMPDNLHGRAMGEDHAVCVMRRSHPLAQQPLSLDDYLAHPHLQISGGGDKTGLVDQHLASLGTSRQVQLTVPFFESALRIVSESDLLLTLPQHMAVALAPHWPIVWHSLPFEVPAFRYWLLWHARQHHDVAHQWLRNQFSEVLWASNYGISQFNRDRTRHAVNT
ncbi:MAG: LysR family transcriptional regulator [Burkholderiales bacterium]|nr:LysR family transcriptional regulator [Burkholderiales bacterium]